jgi:rubrerythrin
MTTQGIDFATLSLKDALDLALLIEEEARDRYAELSDQLDVHHTPEAAAFFRKMVRIEELHRVELEKRRQALFPNAPRTVTRAMLFDVEAPDYDVARAEMTVRQALEAAMKSETKAHDFFVAALPRLTDPEVKALFEELREEELEHQRWVREELERAPVVGDARFGDSDEPVAH